MHSLLIGAERTLYLALISKDDESKVEKIGVSDQFIEREFCSRRSHLTI